jgi:hypothetical protein
MTRLSPVTTVSDLLHGKLHILFKESVYKFKLLLIYVYKQNMKEMFSLNIFPIYQRCLDTGGASGVANVSSNIRKNMMALIGDQGAWWKINFEKTSHQQSHASVP